MYLSSWRYRMAFACGAREVGRVQRLAREELVETLRSPCPNTGGQIETGTGNYGQ